MTPQSEQSSRTRHASVKKPYGPGTEQDEIALGPATYVPMTAQEWDETVDILADILMPLWDKLESAGRLPKRHLPPAA
jgi:hypothetical protein